VSAAQGCKNSAEQKWQAEAVRKMKSWLVGIAGVIAAVAVVASNLDKILSTGATWLGPYIIPYVSPHAVISVALDADLATAVDVFVADPSNETRVIALGQTHRDQKAVLNIPANTRYTIGWQGAGLEAGAAQHILAVKGESLFRLIRMGVADGQIRVSLRQSDPNQPELPTTEPSAKLLISARASQAATNPSIPISTGALPELDRATTIVGLFETGTTDCARRLYFIGRVPAVGCVGASIPGWLGEVITSLDAGDARRLDALLGENAASIRNYAQDRYAIPQETQLRQAMERLIAAPEFWIKYQARVLAAYAQATDAAHQVGLVSERGRLLIFDQLVLGGPGMVTRGTRSYAERYPEGASGRPDSEPARIRALGDIFKSQLPGGVGGSIGRRIDTIISGQGSIRGITFNLDQLGVSDGG
jgi:hypothetical protein